jgi:hypothetical protein
MVFGVLAGYSGNSKPLCNFFFFFFQFEKVEGVSALIPRAEVHFDGILDLLSSLELGQVHSPSLPLY